jgi:Tfp pilus assembly protein PilZ
MPDARRKPRIEPLVIRTRILGDETGSGYLVNLSEGGAFLTSATRLAVGDVVQLKCTLPWALGRFVARARVVWRTEDLDSRDPEQPEGFGVAFVDLGDEAREKLQLYTQRFLQLAAGLESA